MQRAQYSAFVNKTVFFSLLLSKLIQSVPPGKGRRKDLYRFIPDTARCVSVHLNTFRFLPPPPRLITKQCLCCCLQFRKGQMVQGSLKWGIHTYNSWDFLQQTSGGIGAAMNRGWLKTSHLHLRKQESVWGSLRSFFPLAGAPLHHSGIHQELVGKLQTSLL